MGRTGILSGIPARRKRIVFFAQETKKGAHIEHTMCAPFVFTLRQLFQISPCEFQQLYVVPSNSDFLVLTIAQL